MGIVLQFPEKTFPQAAIAAAARQRIDVVLRLLGFEPGIDPLPPPIGDLLPPSLKPPHQ